jgi:hypothetical protein
MGKRLIQAVTITCMLFIVVEIGSNSATRSSSEPTLQVITDAPSTLFPVLKSVFQ